MTDKQAGKITQLIIMGDNVLIDDEYRYRKYAPEFTTGFAIQMYFKERILNLDLSVTEASQIINMLLNGDKEIIETIYNLIDQTYVKSTE